MNELWLDVLDYPPVEAGWYAVVYCWDPQEGMFPSAFYWNGATWAEDFPIMWRSPQTFASKALAEAWAREHDPEK